MKTIVVYYSLSGNTRDIAERIGSRIQADLEEIKDNRNRRGILGFIASGNEAYQRLSTPIDKLKRDPSQYDCVIIGTPIWGGNISTPVRTFLREYKDTFKKVTFFCTSIGTDPKSVFAVMEEITGRKPLAVMNFTRRDLKKQYHLEMVEELIQKIQSVEGTPRK